MPSESKKIMFEEITQEFEKNPYAFISRLEGMTVVDISDFRRSVEKCSERSLVVKHSMAKKVFEARQWAGAEKFLTGQVIVTFGKKEPQDISKSLVEFAKKNDKLVPEGVIFEGQVFDESFVKQLSQLPNRHELLTQVVVRIQSPISGFVMTLNQVLRGFVVALNEIKKQKEGQPQTA